jgi:hypothetical protein
MSCDSYEPFRGKFRPLAVLIMVALMSSSKWRRVGGNLAVLVGREQRWPEGPVVVAMTS